MRTKIFTFFAAVLFAGSMMAKVAEMTCAEAREAALAGSTDEVTVTGYVTSIKTVYNPQYNNITFWMADEVDGGEVFQAYRCTPEAADKLPEVGDKVQATGTLLNYNGIPELAQGGTCVIVEKGTPEEPCLIASGTCGENLTWELTCDSVLTISGTGEMENYRFDYSQQVTLTPWNAYLSDIKSVIISNGVTCIGNWAFDDLSNCTYIDIPNSVARIGNRAFSSCSSLSFLNIPNSVTNIGEGAFVNCRGLTSIEVAYDNSYYSSINGVLFDKDLTILVYYPAGKQGAYVIPNSVFSIGNYAFNNCINLTSIEIPNSVTNIGEYAFFYCSGLNSVKIGNNVTSIGIYAFYGCTSLTSIKISKSVVSFGDYAFSYCPNLAEVTNYAIVPQTISSETFNSTSLSALTLYVPAESLEAYQVADVWKKFGTIQAIEDGETESQYATIADTYNMAQDSVFTLGEFDVVYVVSIQNGANIYIKDSTGSAMIYQPDYGLQAGDHVAAGMQGKIMIYHGLYEIAPITAKDSLTITSGETPAPEEATEVPSLTNVNQYVVYKNVTFSQDTAFVEERRHQVNGIWNNQEIIFYNQYYIGATLKAGKTYNITSVNNVYWTTPQAYPLAVEEVSGETHDSCLIASGTCGENLTWELTCDSVLTISGTGPMTDFDYSIGAPWDSYYWAIITLVTNTGVTSIGDYAFYNCGSNLSSVTISESVTSIGKGAFYGCKLASITIPNSVTTIDNSAFRYCRAITSLSIPNSVLTIGYDAFEYCDNLSTVDISSSVTSIGNAAFAGCKKLQSINVDEANSEYCSIDGVLFNKAQTTLVQYPLGKEDTLYAIPNTVTTIGSMSFSYTMKSWNAKLTSVIIPSSVVKIETTAFWNVSSVTMTNLSIVPQSINPYASEYADFSTCTLYVPAESLEAYKAADVWKDFGIILPIEEQPVETEEVDFNVVYKGDDDKQIYSETITLHLPVAPEIEGFSFLKWQIVTEDLEDEIVIQAVYTANEQSSAPEVYTNPANPAQKLIRNGNIYILTGDKTYTVTGQEVR